MTREKSKGSSEPRTDDRREEHDSPERAAAPPIEREHETYAGVFEEEKQSEEKDEQRDEEKGERGERERR